MANSTAITLHESAEESTPASGDAVDIGAQRNAVKLLLRVTAVSGTSPSVTATLQTSPDGSAGWRDVATVSRSAIGKSKLVALELDQYVRVSWTIGGSESPSVTFSVDGLALTVFATREDVVNGEIREPALANVPSEQMTAALIDASCDAGDILAASNEALTGWSDSLTRRVATLAAYQIMTTNGFRPTGFDELFIKKFDDAWKWLKEVAAGKIRPPGLSPPTELGPQTSSGNPRAPTRYKRRFSDDWGDFH